jgi:hypothetical protein
MVALPGCRARQSLDLFRAREPRSGAVTCDAWPNVAGELGGSRPMVTAAVRCDLVVRGPGVAPTWPRADLDVSRRRPGLGNPAGMGTTLVGHAAAVRGVRGHSVVVGMAECHRSVRPGGAGHGHRAIASAIVPLGLGVAGGRGGDLCSDRCGASRPRSPRPGVASLVREGDRGSAVQRQA